MVVRAASSWIVTGVPAIEPIVLFGVACGLAIVVSIRMLRSLVPAPPRTARSPWSRASDHTRGELLHSAAGHADRLATATLMTRTRRTR